ncbi:hypothetical protein THF1C08_150072 [Vibrio jasicida]|uniref:Uncharacterized protein n=1 Tax=Vibrio jasicida TaxID=766224 RepID=A0AAU9QIK9_9VIBR|nr:hypothetical protein THF1C08_150072 [Vibrio jasicida]CAH1578353.1 hypothetical protein THF1A12_150075 [Vibrio jasicida]
MGIADAKSKRRDSSRNALLRSSAYRAKQSDACNDGRRASDLPFLKNIDKNELYTRAHFYRLVGELLRSILNDFIAAVFAD